MLLVFCSCHVDQNLEPGSAATVAVDVVLLDVAVGAAGVAGARSAVPAHCSGTIRSCGFGTYDV
jgi:hypothetical protein